MDLSTPFLYSVIGRVMANKGNRFVRIFWSDRLRSDISESNGRLLRFKDYYVYATGRQREDDGKTFVCDKLLFACFAVIFI